MTFATVFASLLLSPLGSVEVSVDPGEALLDFTGLGEWDSPGDFQGWTNENVSQAAVSGGVLGGSGAGIPKVQITGIPNGPDLDLGFHDILEIRLQVPAGPAGGIEFGWGTSGTPGFSTGRTATVPPAMVPEDGAFHVYRIDLGLEAGWRGALRDLRILPLGPSGGAGTFALDFVRVGDPGPIYLPNYLYYPEGTAGVNDAVSKHFRIIWGPSDEITMAWGNFNTNAAAIARGNLRNMEDQWQVYTKLLRYREPSESVDPGKRNGKKYKVNLMVGRTGLSQHLGGGYFMGYEGTAGFGYLIIDTSGLRMDPPSWVNPHELGHVFQVHQAGYNNNPYMGFWWECHANWLREQYLRSPLYPEVGKSGFGSAFPRNAQLFHGHGRHYYDHWPIWSYLEENPDDLPLLGTGFTARLWQEALPGEYIYAQLGRMCPEVSVKDLLGLYVRRNVTWDYSNRNAIWGALGINGSLAWSGSYLRGAFAELARRADDPSWWQVPFEMAPMQGAYDIVELVPGGAGDGRIVTVDFRGLPAAGRASDWRACLVAVDGTGAARYGPLWSHGASSISLSAAETRLFLVVVATPDAFIPQTASEVDYPYATHPARARFPYVVQVTGAVPLETRPTNAGQAGASHPRGGGFVARTARVDATAYVGPDAKVLDTAQVRGNARIEDFAIVKDSAQVLENAVVSGHALIRHSAKVLGFGKVRDYGEVRDQGVVMDHGRILEHGTVAETLTVAERGVVKGFAYAWDNPDGSKISGNADIDGDYAAGLPASRAVLCGWLIGADYAASCEGTLPDGLYAGYEFHRDHPSLAEDFFGVTQGVLVGGPAWSADDDRHEGVATFDGVGQYALLPRSVSDLDEITVAVWVKWDGGAPGQRLFEFGSSPTKLLYLTPDDGQGRLLFSIRDGAVEETLAAAALPVKTWKHVAVALGGGTGTLYVDGAPGATGMATIAPESLNAPNTNLTPQANYLARGQDGWFFRGSVDGFRVYSKALDAAAVAALAAPPPWKLVRRGSVWKYNDSGKDLGTSWREAGYNDASWPSGPAQLGFGDDDEETEIADRDQITTYFRHAFTVAEPEAFSSLELRLLRDDGAVVYLNGEKVFRSNMPDIAISFGTPASSTVTGVEETSRFIATPVDPARLAAGRNVLAVEVHQVSAGSSDVSFDLELVGQVAAASRPSFHRGDPNGDGGADISDALAILFFLFVGGPTPGCKESADIINDGRVDTSDVVALLTWLFMTGSAPASPGPPGMPCGPDPDPPGSAGDLGCAGYGRCP